MTNGELYALAQLIVPELTAKAFVQFYNIAFEKISREVRLLTITFKPTTTVYSNSSSDNYSPRERSCSKSI